MSRVVIGVVCCLCCDGASPSVGYPAWIDMTENVCMYVYYCTAMKEPQLLSVISLCWGYNGSGTQWRS
jgi:hypothetical protein